MGTKHSKTDGRRKSMGQKKKDKKKNILDEYAKKVAQKHQEYAKVVREIDKFKPNVEL